MNMCEFCDGTGKNMSVDNGCIGIIADKYSPSGYYLSADSSGGEYGAVGCPIWFCPKCGRELSKASKSMENYEDIKQRVEKAEDNIRHICNENPNCNKAEHCTTAIDCTTIGDLINGEKRYIKGLGYCEGRIKE